MAQPSSEQIARFLQCFEALGKFEAMIHLTQGESAFEANEWPHNPDPDVMAVKQWLTGMAN
jgi:hypothetical protein